jgi:hypothetical protein
LLNEIPSEMEQSGDVATSVLFWQIARRELH